MWWQQIIQLGENLEYVSTQERIGEENKHIFINYWQAGQWWWVGHSHVWNGMKLHFFCCKGRSQCSMWSVAQLFTVTFVLYHFGALSSANGGLTNGHVEEKVILKTHELFTIFYSQSTCIIKFKKKKEVLHLKPHHSVVTDLTCAPLLSMLTINAQLSMPTINAHLSMLTINAQLSMLTINAQLSTHHYCTTEHSHH